MYRLVKLIGQGSHLALILLDKDLTMKKKSDITLVHVPQTDSFISLYKQNDCWSYALVFDLTEVGKLHYGVPHCWGFGTKKEALEAGLYHLAQNTIFPGEMFSLNLALQFCPVSKVEELKNLFQWQNRYKTWESLGYNDCESHTLACQKSFPIGIDYSIEMHGSDLSFR